MNLEEFTKVMVFLSQAYDKEFTKEKISVWYEMFKDSSIEDLKMSVKRLINTSKYLPSIAEIKHEMVTIKNTSLQLMPEKEWELVLKAVRKWGKLDDVYFEPITADTIRAFGQKRLELIETSQIPFAKKEFIDIWLSKKDGIERTQVQSIKTMTYHELLELEQKEIDKQCLLEMER